MGKFHINKHGIPAPCKASKGVCPLGGESSHFDSKESAQAYADKLNADEFGTLHGMEVSDLRVDKTAARDSKGNYQPNYSNLDSNESVQNHFKNEIEGVKDSKGHWTITTNNGDNIHNHFRSHLENKKHGYETMLSSAKSQFTNRIQSGDMDTTFKNEVANFAAKEAAKELSNKKLNGEQVYVSSEENDGKVDWVNKYAEDVSSHSGNYLGASYSMSQKSAIHFNDNMNNENFEQMFDKSLSERNLETTYEKFNKDGLPSNLSLKVEKDGDGYRATGEISEFTYVENDFDTKEEYEEYKKGSPDESRDLDYKFTTSELKDVLDRRGKLTQGFHSSQSPAGVISGLFQMSREKY